MLKVTLIFFSSEDEDFFDAEDKNEEETDDVDETVDEGTNECLNEPPSANANSSLITIREKSIDISDMNSSIDDIDYDVLYEDADADEEDVDMKSHGSVITHLLSQVRIGMDLTKIVLPTFILERRSLLEMYSDFFAHPDIFLAIPNGKDPEERMIRVLRW